MPIRLTNYSRTYRNHLPFGHYDLIIVSLVHQGPEMVEYMANNLAKYVKGNFLWIVHYNNEQYIDENTLPAWVWLVRDTIQTARPSRLLLMAINQALKFSLVNVSSTNVMTLSSGSAFFREFIVPTTSKVSLISHEVKIDPNKCYAHIQEIDVSHLGKCAEYLKSVGSFGWQYGFGGDSDIVFHKLVKNRQFKYLRGAQWSGQIWPYDVARMLVEDLSDLDSSNLHLELKYATEELYLSTYAYNYAICNGLPIDFLEVIIDWNSGYEVKSMGYIEKLRGGYSDGSAVCKLSDNISDIVREYLLI